jgi:hypothetical protein
MKRSNDVKHGKPKTGHGPNARSGSGKKLSKSSLSQSYLNQVWGNPTWRNSFISVAVILISIVYSQVTQMRESGSSLQKLLDLSCDNGACIKDLLRAGSRTLVASRRFEHGWKLFEIPRSMQIWTLDALRDPFIKNNLFKSRHLKTQRPLASEAFLAAHLALLRNSAESSSYDNSIQTMTLAIKKERQQRQLYLDLLPTYEDFKDYHPVSFSLRDLNSKFGANTYFYFLVSRRKAEIESEYKAFAQASDDFKGLVSYEEGGCTAMVYLMDSMNAHHTRHNTQYKYVSESKKFYLYASKTIPSGTELNTSYGDRAE